MRGTPIVSTIERVRPKTYQDENVFRREQIPFAINQWGAHLFETEGNCCHIPIRERKPQIAVRL